jgi:hypothetical protein
MKGRFKDFNTKRKDAKAQGFSDASFASSRLCAFALKISFWARTQL